MRERAVSDPRAAEILLRWLQRARPPEATSGVDLNAMSEAQLERLHAGLVKLATMDEPVLAALVKQVLAGGEVVSSSQSSRVNKKTADGAPPRSVESPRMRITEDGTP